MIRALALGLLLSAPAIAQEPPPLAPAAASVAPAPKPATVMVTLTTSLGPIVLELEKERAPITTANFLHYVDTKRFDGIAFYRATRIQPGYGLIQGGLRNDPKKLFPPIKLEPTSQTGLSHTDGAISMARAAPNSATADFFIVVGGFPTMDADPKQPGDNQGFAVFGHVAQGMDIVKQILASPTSPTLGEGVLKGQMLQPTIRIISARRSG